MYDYLTYVNSSNVSLYDECASEPNIWTPKIAGFFHNYDFYKISNTSFTKQYFDL